MPVLAVVAVVAETSVSPNDRIGRRRRYPSSSLNLNSSMLPKRQLRRREVQHHLFTPNTLHF